MPKMRGKEAGVAVRNWLRAWPVYQQLTGLDR
jgi:hypothetical protein